MREGRLAIVSSGMVTSVGMTAPAACAAIRAGLTNPTPTRFLDSTGEPLISHAVALTEPWRGLGKLIRMAALSVDECLRGISREEWLRIPLLLCVAEQSRPGRFVGLDEQLFSDICALLNAEFSSNSLLVPRGRVSVAVALREARRLVYESEIPGVVIAAVDSLLNWPTLRAFAEADRLLNADNSNGFIPGEGAASVFVTRPAKGPQLCVEGLGFATEPANVMSDEPLRGSGLTEAIRAALLEAGCEVGDLDFRITDLSGEHYYFKEASLALTRTLRRRKEGFDLWHPAEFVGEAGSAIGAVMLAVAEAACRKHYAVGPGILLHAGNDDGERIAVVARYG